MIDLLRVKDSYANPTAEIRALDEFRDLIARDRGSEGDSQGRKKLQACRELAWIYHMYDPLSPYQALELEERFPRVGNAVFDDEGYKPDSVVRKAAERYQEMTESLPVKMLQAARDASQKIISYLQDVDLTEVDDKGRPIHKVNDVMKALENMGPIVDSLEKLEERVKKRKEKDIQARGGVTINKYNE